LGWPDYVCLLVIVWGGVTGLTHGFVRMVVNVIALVAGVGIAAWATGAAVGWFAHLGWVGVVGAWISARLPLPRSVAAMPVGGRVPIAWGEGLPPALKTALQQRAEALFARTSAAPTLGELVSRALAELLISLAVFLLIVVVVQGLLRWAGHKASWWLGARGLTWPDRLAGLLVGAARNALMVSAFAALALPLLNVLAPRGLLQPGGLTYVLAGWFGRFYPWLLGRL
jgi:uncharacterized membrane protein required for colicin V production